MHRPLSAASATPGRQAASPRLSLAPGLEEIAQHMGGLPCHPQILRDPTSRQQKSHRTSCFSLSGPWLGMQSARCWILCARGMSVGTRCCDAESRCWEALPHALATHHNRSDPPAGTRCTPPMVSRVYGASHRRLSTLGTLMIPNLQMRNDTQRS